MEFPKTLRNASTTWRQINGAADFMCKINVALSQIKRFKRNIGPVQNTDYTKDPFRRALSIPPHIEIKPAVNTFMGLPVAQTLCIFLGTVVIIVLIISFIVWIQCHREGRKERARNAWDENRLRILPSRRDPFNCRQKIDDTQIVGFPGMAYPKIKGGVMRCVPLDKKAWVRRSLATIEEEEEEV